jgi:hypothetical protein
MSLGATTRIFKIYSSKIVTTNESAMEIAMNLSHKESAMNLPWHS